MRFWFGKRQAGFLERRRHRTDTPLKTVWAIMAEKMLPDLAYAREKTNESAKRAGKDAALRCAMANKDAVSTAAMPACLFEYGASEDEKSP